MRAGIYIHIPFCDTRCNYCHFITRPWQEETAGRYRRAVEQEIRAFKPEYSEQIEADSAYFGGGTPSLVPAEHIADIMRCCRDLFPFCADCEVTLEANPGSIDGAKVEAYQRIGVNRVSVGAQTFDDKALSAIGRDHTGIQVDETLDLLKHQGISNVNLDLLLGLPQQTSQQWESDLDRAVRLNPSHLSIYMLDLDERSPLYHGIARGKCEIPEDDLVCDLYLMGVNFLENSGYRQYEISNFALPGFESRHNLKYWRRQPVFGFGVGSHSYDGRERYANFSRLAAYFESVETGQSPIEWRQTVGEGQELEEILFLGLRLNRGVDWGSVKREHPGAKELAGFESIFSDLAGKGLLEWEGETIRLTAAGILLSNEVFCRFV